MSVIVVSKKAFNAFRYFTLLFALVAVNGFGASVKLHYDANTYKEAYINASEKIVDINNQLRDAEQEKKLLEERLAKKKAEATKARIAKLASSSEAECLATAIYYEAGGEAETGKWAVAHVVYNRMKHAAFPRTACGVVYQGVKPNSRFCQFSWACDGTDKAIRFSSSAWQESKRIAVAILAGNKPEDVTSGALYFHNATVKPRWATKDRFTTKIGGHYFYR